MSKDKSKDLNADEITLQQALDNDLVVLKSEIDKIVQEEIKKNAQSLREQARKEIREEEAQQRQANQKASIALYMKDTGLTSHEFGIRLRKMNMPRENLQYLRDEHHNLGNKEIWAIVQKNMRLQKRV